MTRIDLHNYEAFLLDYFEGNLDKQGIARLKAFALAHPELEIDLNDSELPSLLQEEEEADFKAALKKRPGEVPDEALLNYLEGHLSDEERIAFEIKLAQDSELARDLELYRKTILRPEARQTAAFRKALYKTEEELVLNNRLIAYLENQLSKDEKAELEAELMSSSALQKEFSLLSKTVLAADESVVHPDKSSLKKEGRVVLLFSLRSVGSVAAAILLLIGLAFIFNYYTKRSEKQDLAERRRPSSSLKEATAAEKKNSDKQAQAPEILKENKEVKTQASRAAANSRQEEKPDPQPVHAKELTGSIEQEKLIAKQEDSVTPQPLAEKHSTVTLAQVKTEENDTALNKQNFLALNETLAEEDAGFTDLNGDHAKGFWKRAVQLAKKANKLGVKSLDGQENDKNHYRLSFNSFSVEKK